jgi:hypothetical protein
MILLRILTCAFYGCIYTSYDPRHYLTKGAPSQPRPNPASARFVTLSSCSTTHEGILPLQASGVSLYQAGSAAEAPRPRHPSQDRLHCQAAIPAGPPTAPLCGSYTSFVERYRQSRPDGDAQSRTEAWLTGGQPGHRALCSGNISSIACSTPSSSRSTKPWSPTGGGPQTNLRR